MSGRITGRVGAVFVTTLALAAGPTVSAANATTDSDGTQISKLVVEFLRADAKHKCGMFQELYVSEYGDDDGPRSHCIRGYTRYARVDRSTGAKVTSIKVDSEGVRAKATVTVRGGPFDGVSGRWFFTKLTPGTDGPFGGELARTGRWRLGEFDINYLRSRGGAELGAGFVARRSGDPLKNSATRRCARTAFGKLNEPTTATAYYEQFNQYTTVRSALILTCVHKLHSEQLRKAYKFELLDALRAYPTPRGQASCAVKSYLGRYSDAALVRPATEGTNPNKARSVPHRLRADLKKCKA